MRPPILRRRRAIVLMAVLAAFLAVAVPVGTFAHRTRRGIEAWEREHNGAAVIGRTPEEVIARFGNPYFLERDPATGAVTVIAYAGPYWNYCGIEFQQGVATRVRFWGK